MTNINQSYAFPHVKGSEKIVGPLPLTTTYRNNIGVAGEFRRGPRRATVIDNLQDFVYLYGSDNTPGAIFVRQAFMQGATNMTISRAIPEPTKANSAISFSNLLPTNEAQVGYSGSVLQFNSGNPVQTTGLRLDVDYCGTASELVRAAGELVVEDSSSFTKEVNYEGLGGFDLVVEDYLETRGQVTVATSLVGASAGLQAAADLVLTTGDTAQSTADFSLVAGGPYANKAAIPNNTYFIFNNGVKIKVYAAGASYDVETGGSVTTNAVALEEKSLNVTSLNTRLEVGSYLYFNGATFKTSVITEASNLPTVVKGFVFSASPNVTIGAASQPEVQAKITDTGVVAVAKTKSLVPQVTVAGSIPNEEELVQYIILDRTALNNQALIANLKPGRLLYSLSSGINFNPTSKKPLVVLSTPIEDQVVSNEVRVLVKGQIDSDGSCNVALYDTSENVYIFSSTFRTIQGDDITFKKIPQTQVERAANPSSLPALTGGQVYLTLAAPLDFNIYEGHTIAFTSTEQIQLEQNAPRFQVEKYAQAGTTTLVGRFVVGNDGDVATGTKGFIHDPFIYSRLQLAFEIEKRQSLVDSFVVSREAAVTKNFNHLLYFNRSDGAVIQVPTGIKVSLKEMGNSGKIAFLLGGTFRVPVASSYVAIGAASDEEPFERGSLGSEIALKLATKISLNSILTSLIEVPQVGTSLNPVTISIKSAFTGTDSNRIKYVLSRTTVGEGNGVTADDLILNATNAVESSLNYAKTWSLKDAVNGAASAFADFYSGESDPLVRVRALSDGLYGNKLSVSIVPGIQGQFTLTVTDNDSADYLDSPTVETMTLSTRDVDISGLFNASANSRLVRVFYIPASEGRYNSLTETELDKVPMRVAPSYGDRIPILNSAPNGRISSNLPVYARSYQGANFLQNIALKGGSDAVSLTSNSAARVSPDALVRAVRALESQDCAIIAAAGVVATDGRYSGVIEEIVGQINRATTMTGLRVGLVQAPPNLSESQAQSIAATLNNSRIVLVAGHITMAGVRGYNNVPAQGVYAGLLATNPPEISPAAAGEGMIPAGVVSVDTPAAPIYLDKVTRARTEALFYDSGLKLFKFLNGRSTTSNTQDHYVSIRRMADEILQNLYTNLIWVRSNQNTPSLRARVQSAVDAYFQTLMREGRISNFRPTICNDSNNTPASVAQGQLNINIFWSPNYPADFINVSLNRQIADSLSIQMS